MRWKSAVYYAPHCICAAYGVHRIEPQRCNARWRSQMKNQQVLLAARPRGPVELKHFRFGEVPIPAAADGEFVVRAHYLSLDPYMRGRMDDAKSYAKKAEVGEVMVGTAVGEAVSYTHLRAHETPEHLVCR